MRKLARAFLFLIILISFTSCIQGIVDVGGNQPISFAFRASQEVVGKTLEVTIADANNGKPIETKDHKILPDEQTVKMTFNKLNVGDDVVIAAQIKDGNIVLYGNSQPYTIEAGDNNVSLELKFAAAKLQITPSFGNVVGFDPSSLQSEYLCITIDGTELTPIEIGAMATDPIHTYCQNIRNRELSIEACIEDRDGNILYKTKSGNTMLLQNDETLQTLEFYEYNTYVLWNNHTNGGKTKGMDIINDSLTGSETITSPLTTNTLVDFCIDDSNVLWTLEDDGTNYKINSYDAITEKFKSEIGSVPKTEGVMNCLTVVSYTNNPGILVASRTAGGIKNIYYWETVTKDQGKVKISSVSDLDVITEMYMKYDGGLYIAGNRADGFLTMDQILRFGSKVFTDHVTTITTDGYIDYTVLEQSVPQNDLKYVITDWKWIGDKAYILACAKGTGTKGDLSKGELWLLDDTKQTTDSTAVTRKITADAGNGNVEQGSESTKLVGSRKFLTNDTDKLVFVDDGVISDPVSGALTNLDRVVTVDINNLATFTSVEVSVNFDGYVDSSSGSYVSGF